MRTNRRISGTVSSSSKNFTTACLISSIFITPSPSGSYSASRGSTASAPTIIVGTASFMAMSRCLHRRPCTSPSPAGNIRHRLSITVYGASPASWMSIPVRHVPGPGPLPGSDVGGGYPHVHRYRERVARVPITSHPPPRLACPQPLSRRHHEGVRLRLSQNVTSTHLVLVGDHHHYIRGCPCRSPSSVMMVTM